MKTLIVVGLTALALTGCQSRKQISEMSYSEIKDLAVVINQRCLDQGVKPEDPQWQVCTKQEISRENANRVRARQVADSTVICNRVGTATICN